MRNTLSILALGCLGFTSLGYARASSVFLDALRHACVAQYLEFGNYDRYRCEIEDISEGRTILPADTAVKYCAAVRLLVTLGEPAARDTESLVCRTDFSANTTYGNGSPILENDELLWPGRDKLLDAEGNLYFVGGLAATTRDQIHYRGSGQFKSGSQWYYRSTAIFRIEDSYNHPNSRTAISSRGILFYPNGVIAGAVSGADTDIYYPNRDPARLNRRLHCPQAPAIPRGNSTGNILTDACTLKNICSASSPENICRTRNFLRPAPALEALASMRLLAETSP